MKIFISFNKLSCFIAHLFQFCYYFISKSYYSTEILLFLSINNDLVALLHLMIIGILKTFK